MTDNQVWFERKKQIPDTCESVLNGDTEIWFQCRHDILTLMNHKFGILADDALTDQYCHFLILSATIMRLCIRHCMNLTVAYHLADFYVSRVQQINSKDSLHHLMTDELAVFTREMKNVQNRRKISRPVRQCIEYIYTLSSEKICSEDLAEACDRSVSWTAHAFSKETGMSVKEYVQREKIARARNMLHYTDLSCAEIAAMLSFSSQSHFTLVFHHETGETPGEWRCKIRLNENS